MLGRMWRNGGIAHWWKSVWHFLRKLDIVLPKNPPIPLLGISSKDCSTYNKNTCSTVFIEALFIIAIIWKKKNKTDVLQQRNGYRKCGTVEYCSTFKNNDFMKFLAKWMELENKTKQTNKQKKKTKNILSEVTQSQKNTHDMHSLISGYLPRSLEYPICSS